MFSGIWHHNEKSDGNVILLHKQGTSLEGFGICSPLIILKHHYNVSGWPIRFDTVQHGVILAPVDDPVLIAKGAWSTVPTLGRRYGRDKRGLQPWVLTA